MALKLRPTSCSPPHGREHVEDGHAPCLAWLNECLPHRNTVRREDERLACPSEWAENLLSPYADRANIPMLTVLISGERCGLC